MRGIDPLDFAVVNTHLRHADGVYDVIRLANGYPLDRYCHCINQDAVAEQLERFPEGQFVAVTYEEGKERVVGMASTMLTARGPDDEPLAWYDMVGSFGLRNHDDDGAWLYGVEIAVHPDYQRHGIGSALYRARLALIDDLELEGWYAGGMLMGYDRYRDTMSPTEYAQRVIAGEINDPTVSMQLRRGFEPRAVIDNYYPEWKAGHAAVLLAFQPRSSEPKRVRAPRASRAKGSSVASAVQAEVVQPLPVMRAGHAGHQREA